MTRGDDAGTIQKVARDFRGELLGYNKSYVISVSGGNKSNYSNISHRLGLFYVERKIIVMIFPCKLLVLTRLKRKMRNSFEYNKELSSSGKVLFNCFFWFGFSKLRIYFLKTTWRLSSLQLILSIFQYLERYLLFEFRHKLEINN